MRSAILLKFYRLSGNAERLLFQVALSRLNFFFARGFTQLKSKLLTAWHVKEGLSIWYRNLRMSWKDKKLYFNLSNPHWKKRPHYFKSFKCFWDTGCAHDVTTSILTCSLNNDNSIWCSRCFLKAAKDINTTYIETCHRFLSFLCLFLPATMSRTRTSQICIFNKEKRKFCPRCTSVLILRISFSSDQRHITCFAAVWTTRGLNESCWLFPLSIPIVSFQFARSSLFSG